VAHEDDAERAVRAGLGMQAAMGEVNEDLPPGVHFDLRVGVNTGEVLADMGVADAEIMELRRSGVIG
jgi:class 3 adenylate cyclase